MLKQISNALFYDDRDLQNLPRSCEFYGNQFADLPFMIIDDFLTQSECDIIVKSALENPIEKRAEVLSQSGDSKIDSSHRSTDWRAINDEANAIYINALNAQKPHIERFFNHLLLEASKPQILGYKIGDFYDSHADNCSKVIGENGGNGENSENGGNGNTHKVIEWKLIKPNRVITTLLFLNDNFEGGALAFDYFFGAQNEPCELKPKAGLMVAFPSNPIFAHSVKAVESGYRLTIAQWHNAVKP